LTNCAARTNLAAAAPVIWIAVGIFAEPIATSSIGICTAGKIDGGKRTVAVQEAVEVAVAALINSNDLAGIIDFISGRVSAGTWKVEYRINEPSAWE
jgi:hypothetical protein